MHKILLIILHLFFFISCVNNTDKKATVFNRKQILNSIDSLIEESERTFNVFSSTEIIDKNIKEALLKAKNNNFDSTLYNIHIIIARRYRNKAYYSKAIMELNKAMNIANRLNNDFMRAEATHETAVNFRKINDNAKALKLHTQALELAESINDTFLIHCSYNGIGNVYFEYKDYPNAVSAFHKSLNYLGKSNPNILGDAINSNLLGESWLFMGNNDSALYYIQRSYNANSKIGSFLGQGICLNGMGLVFFKKKDYKQAKKYFIKSIAIFDSLNVRYYKAMGAYDLGNYYLITKHYTKAEKYLKKALTIASDIKNKKFALDASIKLSDLYNQTGHSDLSYKYSIQALAYKDTITKELQKQNIETMKMLYTAEKQKREIIILKQKAELNELKLSRQQYIIFIIIGFTIITIIFGAFLFKQNELKNRINKIGLEQKLLRAQLNPHFIFNSLAAIQNFIMKNDRISASEYLVNFSRLMRNILMGSGTDFILLRNEIEILEDYLKLQRLRLQNKFEYYFNIAPAINIDNLMIPPMLVQPFVENAIEHGVRNIDHKGIIEIRFNQIENTLIIEVEDNGNGLTYNDIKKQKTKHVSMATKITKQRLDNIHAITKRNCKFEVINKSSVNRNDSGVIVRIEIPVWHEI